MLSFAHLWLFALLPLPLLVWWLLPAIQRRRPALRVPFFDRVSQSSPQPSATARQSSRWIGVTRGLIWILVVASLARPQWIEPPVEKALPTRDLLLLVDLSTSMVKEDFTIESGKAVDRLVAVKEVLGDFLTQREGDRVGLVVFGSAAFLQVPFTTDLELCRQLLDETAIGMAGPKTALGDAIGLGINLFEESELEERTIIMLTDGNDTASMVPPVEAARVARDRGIKIHTVAIGDPLTVGEEKLDEATLKEVSKITAGAYFLAMNRGELDSIYEQLDQIETTEVDTVSHQPRTDLFFYPLAAALVLGMLAGALTAFGHRASRRSTPLPRVRVNTRTFELEVNQ